MDNNVNKVLVKKLDICFPPPLYYSLHVAISLSIIFANDKNKDWLYNNFIQVSFCGDDNITKGGHKYCIYPSMEMRPGQNAASKFLVEKHIDLKVVNLKTSTLCDSIKLFIDNDYYVSCIVDVTKLHGTRYEGRDFMPHRIMIFGYDFESKLFDILDFDYKQAINKIKITMEDFIFAFTSEKLLNCFNSDINNTLILFERRNTSFTPDFGLVKEALQDYLNSYNSSIRYSIILPRNDDFSWGISTYKDIIEYLNSIADFDTKIDIRLFHALFEHKKIMFERFKYFDAKDIYHLENELSEELNLNVKIANISKMLALKYNLTGDSKIVNNIVNKLKEIEEKEKHVYEQILETS